MNEGLHEKMEKELQRIKVLKEKGKKWKFDFYMQFFVQLVFGICFEKLDDEVCVTLHLPFIDLVFNWERLCV